MGHFAAGVQFGSLMLNPCQHLSTFCNYPPPSPPPPGQPVLQPPSPPTVLGLGHMLPMMGHLAAGVQFESLMLKWRREYGPFFEFRLPNNPAVVIVADPDAIKEVSSRVMAAGVVVVLSPR